MSVHEFAGFFLFPDTLIPPMAEQRQGEVSEQLCSTWLAAGDKP